MLAAGLIEMPPVSNVTPLPTSATFLAFFGFFASFEPRCASRTSRGGRDEPLPTPITPPYPSRDRSLLSSTSTSSPADSPKAFARLANSAGNR